MNLKSIITTAGLPCLASFRVGALAQQHLKLSMLAFTNL